MLLLIGVAGLNYWNAEDEKRRTVQEAALTAQQMKIRELRDRRQRALDAPARLEFKRRQLRAERADPGARSRARVEELEKEVAALEVECLTSLSK